MTGVCGDRDPSTGVDEQERAARAALTAVVEPGRPALAAVLAAVPAVDVVARLRAGEPRLDPDGRLARLLADVDGAAVLAAARARGMEFVVPGEPSWPLGLACLARTLRDGRGGLPVGLWLRGEPSLLDPARPVGVVGSRAATAYGLGVATDWAAELAGAGAVVLSGAAYGIDAAAHRGALAVGRPTVAVLAGGLDLPYPRGNAGLIDRIAEHGLLVSECAPGSGVNRSRFLLRNRLIAALSHVVLVVEAGRRSGALSTAAWAEALLRPVAAVPGPVTSSLSLGTHHLIREQRAVLVSRPDEVSELLADYGDLPEPVPAPVGVLDGLGEVPATVREAMPARGPISLAELLAATGLALPEVLAALDVLVARGLVEGAGESWRLRPPRRAGP
jgi:DNA processing protein